MTLSLPTKSRITAEARRDDYAMTFVLRVRRNWKKMSLEERHAALVAGANQLDEYARQMRTEAEEITSNDTSSDS